jgi:hypothetical protein
MNITFPVIELLDRLVIAKIKLDKTNANQDEYDYYAKQADQFDLTTVRTLLDELEQVHLAIWALESDLRRGLEENLGLEEIGRRAVAIRNHNNRRVEIKNQLAEQLECSVREIKKDHLSA